jgi:4-amino-4-deoxy-L-arabinose transferase-like glycosyltransferase
MQKVSVVQSAQRVVGSPAIIFLVAVAFRLWSASRLFPNTALTYFYDRNEAVHIAWALATGHGFSSPWPNTPFLPTAQQPPLYPFLLAGIFKLFGVYTYHSLYVAIVLNSIFAALTAVLSLRIGEIALDSKSGILAAWFWSCSLLESAASVRLWESSLSALWLATSIWLLLLLNKTQRIRSAIMFGVVAGLASLTNTSLLAPFPFLVLWLWWTWRRNGRPCNRALILSIAACLLVLTPWTTRNLVVFHRFIPIRDNFGLELWVGNGHDTDFSIDNVKEFDQAGEIAFMEGKRQNALGFIHAHPSLFVRSFAWRAFHFWIAPVGSAWCWISLFAWIGLVLPQRQKKSMVAPFALIMIVYPFVYYVTHTHVTYRFPIEPVILLMAAYAVVGAGKRFFGAGRRNAAINFGALTA